MFVPLEGYGFNSLFEMLSALLYVSFSALTPSGFNSLFEMPA